MILRFGSLLLILYALGFALFGVTLGKPAATDAARTEGIVVITGGAGRIEHGVQILADGHGQRLLVAGTDPAVTKADLIRRLGGKRWLERRQYKSLRLVTSDWHMRRARYEFRRVLGDDYRVVPDAVRTEPGFMTLFGEYNKYLLRRIAVWLDI